MKAILRYSLLLCLPFCFTVAHSQTCSREVTSFDAAPGGYDISGTALLESQEGVIILSFDPAFSTLAGPDLHVYLAIHFESPATPGNTNVDLGVLTSNSGAQSFQVPSGVALSDYDYVLIHCKTFNHWWGGGLLGLINCVSAIEPVSDEMSFSLYPNPANTQCSIQINAKNSLRSDTVLKIINNYGETVKVIAVQGPEVILSLGDISPGTYFVQLVADGDQQMIQKMLVME